MGIISNNSNSENQIFSSFFPPAMCELPFLVYQCNLDYHVKLHSSGSAKILGWPEQNGLESN